MALIEFLFNLRNSPLLLKKLEKKCIKHLEKRRWKGKVISPFDLASQVYKCANGRFKCKKYFNAKTRTIFKCSKNPYENKNFVKLST